MTQKQINLPLLAGGICGFLAILVGAYVEHGLKGALSAHDWDAMATALRYQLIHALLLVALGIADLCLDAEGKLGAKRRIGFAASFVSAGIILFSGGIELSILTTTPWLLHLAPSGGIAFMLGWLTLASLGIGHRPAP